MSYLTSDNVRVFPAPNRDTNYTSAYLLNEKNLGGIIRTLYKRNNSSFVSEVAYDNQNNTISAVFVLYGFYFEVNNIAPQTDGVWANIYVKKDAGTDIIRLVTSGGDDTIDTTNGFEALTITHGAADTAKVASNVTTYSIQLVNTTTAAISATNPPTIPEASKMKWNADTLNQSISFDDDSALVINTNPDSYE